ncbi:MAG: alpha/beta fold hydrolase [Alphaproteobacteria bacterium]|nr:alpha/beta fold hydrolase [Alphaproteobacteria bacterium]MDP6816285.1 alpha/beta fold hydrolase [Alphaproteobacteria bacterium]
MPSARDGSLPWRPELAAEAAALMEELRAVEPTALTAAVAGECHRRMQTMLDGVRAYRGVQGKGEANLRLTSQDVVWRQGTTRLLDYGGDGVPALFVPSLVNRARVLDLTDDRSLLRWLRRHGVRPFLVDWDQPGPGERDFSLTEYIRDRLSGALDAATAAAGGPVFLVGYCMGGNLALALALRRQADLAGLALLATPWDFHAERAEGARLLSSLADGLEVLLRGFGELPVDILQTLFAALDPNLAQRKFRHFADLDPAGEEAAHFVALEDWVNDGVPLAAAVARECLIGWYGDNSTAQGAWLVDGQPVAPERLRLPTLLAIPDNDRIVPAASARALARAIPGAEVIVPPAGHIGMVVGSRGKSGLWRPLAEWLATAGQAGGATK